VGIGKDKPLPGINASDEEDTTKDQMQTGHVVLKIDVSGYDKEKRKKEQEPMTSRGIKEVFEKFYEVTGYFTLGCWILKVRCYSCYLNLLSGQNFS